MGEHARPADIVLDGDAREMRITWDDGHESRYRFSYLRLACPCAICRGHGPGTAPPLPREDELTAAQTTVVDAGAVGHYALSLVWQDGHDTGIYPFSYLRAICPCGGAHEDGR